MSRLIVKPHNPGRSRAMTVGLVVAALLTGWGLFEYGRSRAGYDVIAAQQEQMAMTGRIDQQQKEIASLREEKAILDRSVQIDRKAYKELETTVTSLQAQIAEFKGQLAFYRGIVSPNDAQQGLRVDSFEVTANGVENGYRYKLVLTQVLKNDRLARGKVSVDIEGLEDGQNKVLSLQDLTSDANKNLAFNFKYFQNFEGDLKLPTRFVPLRAVVRVELSGSADKIEKVFDWPQEEV